MSADLDGRRWRMFRKSSWISGVGMELRRKLEVCQVVLRPMDNARYSVWMELRGYHEDY